MKSLCETCCRADNDCPIWEPGKQTTICVEYRPMTTLIERITTIKKECEEIIALSEKATKGPWFRQSVYATHVISPFSANNGNMVCDCPDSGENKYSENASFIARARNSTPKMARVVLKQIDLLEPMLDTTDRLIEMQSGQSQLAHGLLTAIAEEFEKGKL